MCICTLYTIKLPISDCVCCHSNHRIWYFFPTRPKLVQIGRSQYIVLAAANMTVGNDVVFYPAAANSTIYVQ